MNYNMEIESRLRALEERRNMLDKKIEAKLDTIAKFNEIRQNSKNRLNAALDKQDAEAKVRNAELMKKLMSVPLSSTLLAQRKCVVDNEEKLREAKDLYSRQMEAMLPALHRNQTMLLEEKIKEIKAEKQQSQLRRNKLNQELVYEERVKVELEKQRRDLISSLALEQQDIMQAQANSIMMAMDGAEADRLVYEQVATAGNNLKGLVTNSLSQKYGSNLEDLRQQQQLLRGLSVSQYNTQAIPTNLTSTHTMNVVPPNLLPFHSKQGRSFADVSNDENEGNSSVVINRALDRPVLEQKMSEPMDTRFRMLVDSPRQLSRSDEININTASATPVSTKHIESSLPAEPLASPRGDRSPVPVLVTTVKVTPAPMASLVATPIVIPPTPPPVTTTVATSVNLRKDHSMYVSEDEFDDVANTHIPSTSNSTHVMLTKEKGISELPRIESEESFPSIPEEPVQSSPRLPQPTAAESVAALYKILNNTSDCVKCLKALLNTIENRVMFIRTISDIYVYTPANDTEASGNTYRNRITEFLTLLLDPASAGSLQLEKFNDDDRLLGDTVLRIVESKASLLIPKDAFMGVMTLEKLKKEHKKLPQPGPVLELWDVLTSHLQRLIEANSTYLTYLASTFTTVLISHIPPEDKDRLNRKVSSLLQLAMIPPSDGKGSPDPPYRRKSEEIGAEPIKLSNRFNEVVAATTSVVASSTSSTTNTTAKSNRPVLTTKVSSKIIDYDSLQVPTKAASEFDDEEFLEEESLQAPPSMKDLDQLHSGSSNVNKKTNAIATAAGSGGGGKVIQVGRKDTTNSVNNDEFDF